MRPTTAIVVIAVIASMSKPSPAAITNPLMPDTLLFVVHEASHNADHMVNQYLGYTADKLPGSGIFLLTGAKSGSPQTRNILANSTVTIGRLAGQKLTGGSFLSPELSYDARTIVFAWVAQPMGPGGEDIPGWTQDNCYHIFKVNADGTGLTQLTDGAFNEFDPCFLPNGRIVYISERRSGYGRCHGEPKPTYTLFSMKADGSDSYCIAYHETNQWHPSVDNDGMIVFTQWDYIDRDDCIAHHLWTCSPDGCNPRAYHGNYPLPWSTMNGSNFTDGRWDRPHGEWSIRAIPNSTKYVAVAAGHHTQAFGDLITIDPSIPDDNKMSQVTCITTAGQGPYTFADGEVPMPYGTPWPLSEDYFLANKSNSIILIDKNGAEQTVYTSTTGRPIDPIPFRPRTKPPSKAVATFQGERASLPDHKRATISIMNANFSDLPLPANRKVASIRVLQLIPQTYATSNTVPTGYASEGLCRMSLGTAPVDPDGSAYFEAPVGKLIYFQLLDEKGMAIQSMRAGTYVHAGEQLTCYGCHEDKWKATPAANPTATRRAPSPLTPEPGAESNGVTPVNFYRLVKPVFTAKCAPCHQARGQGPATMTYPALQDYAFYFVSSGIAGSQVNQRGQPYPPDYGGYTNGDLTTPIHGGSRTTPGLFGAAFSRMGKALLNSTHQSAGITTDEFRRVTLWLDANSMELSSYSRATEQRAGALVWPEVDFDPQNPTGVESNYPPPTGVTNAWVDHSRPGASASVEKLIVRGRVLEMENPGAGPVRVRICDAAGRTIIDRLYSGTRIAVNLPQSRQVYLASLLGPDGRTVQKSRSVVWAGGVR